MTSTSLEYIAATAEEAIQKGLTALNVTREEVDIEVLEAGSKGFLGIGSRQAKVRLTVRADSLRASIQKDSAPAQDEEEQPEEAAAPVREEAPAAEAETPETDEVPAEAEEEGSNEVVNDATMKIAANVVRDLLEKMRVKATINSKIAEAADEVDSRVIMIDILGDDLSFLIGRHSEVLHSLQYITSLIVGREVGHWVPLIIDVQGYRERRERQLRQMASRMAEQVVKTGRRISLEPMTATERRIIHLALRDNNRIMTESIGEEPNRKVVIYPKENK